MNPISARLYRIAMMAAASLVAQAAESTAFAQVIVPSPVGDIVQSPLDDPLLKDAERRLERRRERALENEVDAAADPVEAPLQDVAPDRVLETVDQAVDETVTALPGAAHSVANAAVQPLRPFVEGVDPFGRAIEEDVLIVLVEPGELANIEQSGLPVRQQRALPSLDLVLARIEGPQAPSLAQAAVDIRRRFPGAAVDYNFLYRPADNERQARPDAGAAPAVTHKGYLPRSPGVRLGLIDSAVSKEHSSLADVRIFARDFVPYEGKRPLGHGTAVASIMAANLPDDAEILAASVFFQKRGYAPGASTESLLEALDWLAGSQVDVINMSLAGPADELLERALVELADDGPTVVAAVGNNGPTGEPLYPAAYESVLGITAIDRERRIFAYANRGDHVAFAAPGVNVKVADGSGSWRMESGTSMASPYVAAVIADALHASELPKDAVIESLQANAVDLGDEGFDPVFGYGLVQPPRGQNAAASLTE
ncbi:MAG: S8 family serine peptidase [Woeseiaceae bacterium]